VVFDEFAADLGRAAGFPSDLEADGGLLYTVDDATIPCNLVALQAGSLANVMTVSLEARHLRDMDGTSPARAASASGPGLFGAFTGDIEVAFHRYLFVTVGAGNSVSTDGTNPLRLANLVVVDGQTRQVLQCVNLAWPLQRQGTMSTGQPHDVIPQSLPVMCAFVPADDGSHAGHVYVALSNGAGSNAGLGTFFSGTVQAYRVDFSQALPLSPETAGKAAADPTLTYVASRHNPVALTRYETGDGRNYLLLTAAGASLLDASFVAHPTTSASIDVLDLAAGKWRSDWTVDLGPFLPSVHRIPLARDRNGVEFGLLGSQTYAALLAVELSGLESDPVEPGLLRVVRTMALASGGATTEGSAYLPSVAIRPSGNFAVVSSFNDSRLVVVGLPERIDTGFFAVNPPPFDGATLSSATGLGVGAITSFDGPGPDIYAVVNGNFAPARNGSVGTLEANGQLP